MRALGVRARDHSAGIAAEPIDDRRAMPKRVISTAASNRTVIVED